MIMKVVTIHTKVSIRATCCSPGWTMILYTHRRCLEVAPLRHAGLSRECPFTGVDRKSSWSGQTDANDPLRTSASISFYGSEAGFRPINVLVLADTMLLPDHEGGP
jgi:hypothetical protein